MLYGIWAQNEEVHGAEDGALPDHWANPEPIFQSVVIDLFGPIEY